MQLHAVGGGESALLQNFLFLLLDLLLLPHSVDFIYLFFFRFFFTMQQSVQRARIRMPKCCGVIKMRSRARKIITKITTLPTYVQQTNHKCASAAKKLMEKNHRYTFVKICINLLLLLHICFCFLLLLSCT